MTILEIRALSGEALRIAVAEAEGWKRKTRKMYAGEKNAKGWELRNGDNWKFTTYPALLPDYESNRDAITEAILRRFTTDVEKARFSIELMKIVDGKHLVFTIANASATDLSRAYLAAISTETTNQIPK